MVLTACIAYTERHHCCITESLAAEQVCSGEIKEEDKETGAVLKCLVKNAETVSDVCSREISRSLRAALQFYQAVSLHFGPLRLSME